jgi:hypothetical protein
MASRKRYGDVMHRSDPGALSRFPLRLPADLRRALQECADRDVRSLNAEIIYLLRRAVASLAADGA